MKLSRWAMAGAPVFVIYKYSIGKKTRGTKVFTARREALDAANRNDGKRV